MVSKPIANAARSKILKKKILKTIYKFGGFVPFHWASRSQALILTYHRFSVDEHPLKISAGEFASHLDYLKKHTNVLPLSAVAESFSTGVKLPPNSVAITIDDGYSDAYEIAFPELRRFGLHATLFAITDFVEGKIWLWTDKMRYVLQQTSKGKVSLEFGNYDTIEADLFGDTQRLMVADNVNSILKKLPEAEKELKILEIARGLDVSIPEIPPAEFGAITWEMACDMDSNDLKIESHTVTHPILTNIDENRLKSEIRDSKEKLETNLNRPIEAFCYPNGVFDEKVGKAVESAGYKYAVTTRSGFVRNSGNGFLLNRVDAHADIADFAQTVSGFESFKMKMRSS